LFCVLAATAEENKYRDCFAVFILTHGCDSGRVYGKDGAIAVSKLMEPLKKNEKLVGKPKMVFIQVCQLMCNCVYDKHMFVECTHIRFVAQKCDII